MDRREEILSRYSGYIAEVNDEENCSAICIDDAKDAMDVYATEMCLEFLRFALKRIHGHSVDAAQNVEIKYNGEWITPEKLFENFS
jgi:hypothetical protein